MKVEFCRFWCCRVIWLWVLLCIGGEVARGQTGFYVPEMLEDIITKVPPKYLFRYADEYFEMGDYYTASELYVAGLSREPTNVDAMFKAAMSFWRSRDYSSAEKWFREVLNRAPEAYPEAGYWLALMLQMNGKYHQAKEALTKFEKEYLRIVQRKDYQQFRALSDRSKLLRASLDFAINYKPPSHTPEVIHLGNGVNTAYTEMSPLPLGDSMLVYASLRSDSLIVYNRRGEIKNILQMYRIRFYVSEFAGEMWVFRGEWDTLFNRGEWHVANGAVAPISNDFYFTRCEAREGGRYRCEIWVSKWDTVKKQYKKPEPLPAPVNHPEYTATQPSVGFISKSGQKIEVLYFVSDRPEQGHRGGMDIWFTYRDPRTGEWARIANLGGEVNTAGDEITPWWDPETQTLYFASDGHPGFGGLDIFKVKGSGRSWGALENLGKPINSSADDLYFTLSDDRRTGFLVSNRVGVIALKHPTCCDDIFMVKFPIPRFILKAIAYDEADSLRKPLDSAFIAIRVLDTVTQSENELAQQMVGGACRCVVKDLLAGQIYKVVAERKGYFSGVQITNVPEKVKEADTVVVMVPLKKLVMHKPYILRNIYYDFDKWTLKPESYPVLDTLVMLLKENSTLKVEIRSHTDSMGSEEYNLQLSQKRAESVVKYLVSKGIDQSRLVAKGYGESQPIAPNSLPDGRDNPEGRAKNRRTEFVVIGEVPVRYEDVIYEMLQGNSADKTNAEKGSN